MPVWLLNIAPILKGAYLFGQLMLGLAKQNKKTSLKECSLALERAIKSKDTTELEKLLLKMKQGESCD